MCVVVSRIASASVRVSVCARVSSVCGCSSSPIQNPAREREKERGGEVLAVSVWKCVEVSSKQASKQGEREMEEIDVCRKYIYIYIYICMCVCVCECERDVKEIEKDSSCA